MCFEKFNSISQISNIENSNFLNYDSIGLISDKNNKIIELNEQIHEENKQLVKLQNNTLKKTIIFYNRTN